MDDVAERRRRLEARRETLRNIRVTPPALSSSLVLSVVLGLLYAGARAIGGGGFVMAHAWRSAPFIFVVLAVSTIAGLRRLRARNLAEVEAELERLG